MADRSAPVLVAALDRVWVDLFGLTAELIIDGETSLASEESAINLDRKSIT